MAEPRARRKPAIGYHTEAGLARSKRARNQPARQTPLRYETCSE